MATHAASETIRACLRVGGVIAYPTEGVWGLGCLAGAEAAVMRILELKSRTVDKGLILLGTTAAQFDSVAVGLAAAVPEPDGNPVTWLVPHRGLVPFWIHGGSDKVALRLPRHPVVAELCESVGEPLVSTSANPAGAPPAMSEEEVREYFPSGLDAIVPGALGGASGPSRIVDLETGAVVRLA